MVEFRRPSHILLRQITKKQYSNVLLVIITEYLNTKITIHLSSNLLAEIYSMNIHTPPSVPAYFSSNSGPAL